MLGERQEAVRNTLLELRSATNKEVAERLSWPINSVTPRMQELRALGVVTCIAGRPHLKEDHLDCPCRIAQLNGRPATMWKVIAKRW